MTAKAIGILVGLAIAFLVGYHFGGLTPQLKAAKAEIKQEAAQDQKRTTDQNTVAGEAKTFEKAQLDPLPAPVVRVCLYTPLATVSSAHTAGPRIDAPVPNRSPAPVPVEAGPDIGPSLVRVGHVTDAQVAGLQHYIEHVCQAKTL